ncbi:hypothetical protein BBJ28_00007516 [Nothophytophthora sp. Chile5]|nr:hypothetical protein BBJ28_00007516 [Nothophytophthora sp. Chile5]
MPSSRYYSEVLDARKGRSAIATASLRAGSCILETQPAAVVSLTACGWCLAGRSPLSRCSGCRHVRYCSRSCQRLDWTQHRRECGAWRSIPASSRSQTVLLVARLALQLFLPLKTASSHENAVETQVLTLRHHLEDHTELQRAQYREMTQLVLLLLSRSTLEAPDATLAELQKTLESEIEQLFGRVNCNAFSLASELANEPVGIGLFPEGALFNHDCSPNCIVSFRGRQMRVHVVRDVAVGEELTVSYVELLQSTSSRRRELQTSYFFSCICQRCSEALRTGESSEDWYLDGLACNNRHCGAEGVVVVDGEVAVCKRCGTARDTAEIYRFERELKAVGALQGATTKDKWKNYQRAWELAVQRLQLHPRNARMAAMAREIGNFLADSTVSELLSQQSLPFFLAELRAVEWLLPTMKLPSRGLLHLQIGRLMAEEALPLLEKTQRSEKAVRHLREALAM